MNMYHCSKVLEHLFKITWSSLPALMGLCRLAASLPCAAQDVRRAAHPAARAAG